MDGLTIGLIVTGIASVVALIVNISFASRAVGTVDEWQQLQQSIYGFVYGGLTMTVFLMCTAWLLAALLGPSMAWSVSLILSIFAFGTAFGAVAMASVPRA